MNLTEIAHLLRRFTPTEEELTAADVLEFLDAEHQDDAGTCLPCGQAWPCARRIHGEQLAVRALGWATDRHLTHVPHRDRAADDELPLTAPRVVPFAAGPSDDELRRLRYPPDGDIGRWVRDGPPGHINYPGTAKKGPA